MCKHNDFYDELAVINSLAGSTLIKNFTIEKVVAFLRSLGVTNLEIHKDYIVCPTICHNSIDEAESMKLYYYDATKNFHCYTECSENFSIVTLYQKYMAINHQEITYTDAVYYLRQFINIDQLRIEPKETVTWKYEKEEPRASIITLPEINSCVLDCFIPFSHPLWEEEGITKEAQRSFDIRFSFGNNKIIIPHRDINGRLIGIRTRAIDEEDMILGKYRPIQIGQNLYNHQLGFNLYGIWEHKEAIRKTKRAVIYEGEKSVLKDSVFYGDYSVAVATCGSQLNKFQINLLVQCLGVNEIILAYDKEYDNPFSPEGKKYRDKLIHKCEKYRGLVDFYYIFDEHNKLDKKDAPCDKGQETLEYLMKRRIKIK